MHTKLYATLALFLCLTLGASPVLAEEGSDGTDEGTEVESGPSHPRPPFYVDAIRRANEVKQRIEDRQGMMQDGFLNEHPGLENRIRGNASTTEDGFPRGEEFRNRMQERASTTGRFLERRQFLREHLENHEGMFASSTALRQANFSEEMRGHIIERAEHAGELFDAMLERLLGIASRIDERIQALASEGVDTTEAEAALEEAGIAIDEAETAVANVKTAMQEALDSETPKDQLETVRALAETAKEALREAHQALMEVVRTLPKSDTTE